MGIDDQISFQKLLVHLEKELLSGKRNKKHAHLYEKFYDIKTTPKRGIKLKPKQQAMDKAQKNYGYFAIISNKEKDPLKALQVYRSKDIIEKSFGNLKKTSTWAEHKYLQKKVWMESCLSSLSL